MSTPLNILEVISDQHQAACTGYEGHPQAITPNMDRLAAMGTRFRYAYTQNPICTPSRVSILSGQYCHNHGYFGLSGPRPHSLPSFLSHFRGQGYRTAGIGKLHTPNDPEDWLRDHCDLYAECYSYGERSSSGEAQSLYYDFLLAHGRSHLDDDSVALPEFRGAQQHDARPSILPLELSVEGWCVSTAKRFIDESHAAAKPFCMQVSLPRPHQCYTPDRRFWEMYGENLDLPATFENDCAHRPPHFRAMVERARTKGKGLIEPTDWLSTSRRVWRGYLACITQVDWALGELINHVEQLGLLGNTVIIYHADHGAYSGTFGVPEKAPGICSEAVCRVPYLWYVPGMTQARAQSTQLVENIDLAPTITSLCGLPAMDTTDGHDLTPLLRGGDQTLRGVAVTEHPWSKSIRWDRWRLVHYQPAMFPGGKDRDTGELYDIEADPWETRNLYHDPAHRATVEEGRRLLLEWLIDTTRQVTYWPEPGRVDGNPYATATAADGKIGNHANPHVTLKNAGDNALWSRNYL
ncbi:MAG: sulfatase-like hydrolase/transferase [Phycisphaera sp.]|nr:sulfatase-like hydrolase/transferase [Phycisphaera sp.]